jgi:WhiB family transcriptional regulator, redox-sensing transcriptional regulator
MVKYIKSPILKQVNWRQVAACRDEDPELFFPIGNNGPALAQIEDAREVCRDCPAIGYCALFAFETGQDNGVWAGMTEEDRRSASGKKVNPLVLGQALQDMYIDAHPEGIHLPPLR